MGTEFPKKALLMALVIGQGCFTAASAVAEERPVGATAGTSSAASDRRLSELFYQLQVLQQEVQELRGLVEEQNFQLNRLARDQKEQYMDLDRRLAAGGPAAAGTAGGAYSASQDPAADTLGSNSRGGTGAPAGTQPGGTYAGSAPSGGSTAGGAVAGLPSAGLPNAGQPAAGQPGAGIAGTERDSYQQAFDLMKGRKFDDSVAAFNRLIVNYPNGQYTPNAFYWLGELYLAQQNTEQARQSFMQVISLYPDHPKVPDTLYKLGVAYHRLGDTNRAMEYFSQVRSQYPQSSAAGLAASYAQEIR